MEGNRYRCGFRQTMLGALAALLVLASAPAGAEDSGGSGDGTFCVEHHQFCADSEIPLYERRYLGADEPSLLFYSDRPGSGNNAAFTLTLPQDPPLFAGHGLPGAVTNADLYDAFWFGMAMCDTQSGPETGTPCIPDSDANIYENPDPSAPDYIGKHPGTAFMEMQFYPPGSVFSVDGKHWYAALNIFSVGFDQNKGIPNNQDCASRVGLETYNSAHLTLTGKADIPAGPLSQYSGGSNAKSYLAMNPGDTLTLLMHDTPEGFQVMVDDLTSGERGSMTASVANGFSQVVFDPGAAKCTAQPYAFHPMYSTSSERTRVPWTVHAYSLGVAVEIGHAERADGDADFGAGGGQDSDFDGYSYLFDWAGTGNAQDDAMLHPQPIRISGPVSSPPGGGILKSFQRAAFEADLPFLENNCDSSTGAGCTNPPRGARFYPFFTAGADADSGCVWQFGGPEMAGTKNKFGGSSTTEFTSLVRLWYPGSSVPSFGDYRGVLDSNPCQVRTGTLPRLHVPRKLSFPSQPVGSRSALKPVDIENRYRLPVSISSIVAAGDFAVKDTNCPNTLPPLSSCQVDVSFVPHQTGIRTGSLTINDNALNTPQIVILRGTSKVLMVPVFPPRR